MKLSVRCGMNVLPPSQCVGLALQHDLASSYFIFIFLVSRDVAFTPGQMHHDFFC